MGIGSIIHEYMSLYGLDCTSSMVRHRVIWRETEVEQIDSDEHLHDFQQGLGERLFRDMVVIERSWLVRLDAPRHCQLV
jgi:hypothetical protein